MAHATGAPALLPFARCLCLARKSRLSKRATGHRRLRRQRTGHLWLQGASRAVPGVVRTPARAPARRGHCHWRPCPRSSCFAALQARIAFAATAPTARFCGAGSHSRSGSRPIRCTGCPLRVSGSAPGARRSASIPLRALAARLTFICWLADFRARKAALSDMYTPSVLHMRRCMPRNLRTACSRTAGRDAGGVRRQPRLAARCVTPSRGRRRAAGKQYADTCPWLSTARAHCSQSRSMTSMSMSMSRDSESLRSASSAPPR